jgi:hypothetical protein
MGIAIAVIYLPLLSLISFGVIALSVLPLRAAAKNPSRPLIKSLAYLAGTVAAILVTIVVGWYATHERKEWDVLVPLLASSLLVPACVGILLFLVANLTRMQWLNYMTAGALHSTIAVPVLGILALIYGDDVVYKGSFDQLCKNAQIVIVEKVDPAQSVALLPDYFEASNRVGNAQQSLGPALAYNFDLEFLDIQVPFGSAKGLYKRLTRVPSVRDAAPEPNTRDRISEATIGAVGAQYEVTPSRLPIQQDLATRMHGQRIEVRRTTDKKLVAFAQYYWDDKQFWDCPAGVSDHGYISSFIVNSLNIRKR